MATSPRSILLVSHASENDDCIRELIDLGFDVRQQACNQILTGLPDLVMVELIDLYEDTAFPPEIDDLHDAMWHGIALFRYKVLYKNAWKPDQLPIPYILYEAQKYLHQRKRERLIAYHEFKIYSRIPLGPVADPAVQEVISALYRYGDKYRKCREAYRLKYGFAYTHREVAEILATTEANSRTLCKRAREHSHVQLHRSSAALLILLLILSTSIFTVTRLQPHIAPQSQTNSTSQRSSTRTVVDDDFAITSSQHVPNYNLNHVALQTSWQGIHTSYLPPPWWLLLLLLLVIGWRQFIEPHRQVVRTTNRTRWRIPACSKKPESYPRQLLTLKWLGYAQSHAR